MKRRRKKPNRTGFPTLKKKMKMPTNAAKRANETDADQPAQKKVGQSRSLTGKTEILPLLNEKSLPIEQCQASVSSGATINKSETTAMAEMPAATTQTKSNASGQFPIDRTTSTPHEPIATTPPPGVAESILDKSLSAELQDVIDRGRRSISSDPINELSSENDEQFDAVMTNAKNIENSDTGKINKCTCNNYGRDLQYIFA